MGVTQDAAGGAFTAGATKMRGIYFRGDIAIMDQGTVTSLGTPTAGAWQVVISSDGLYLSAVATKVDGSQEFSYKWPVSPSFQINNVAVFNSDSRNLAGHSVGVIGARGGISTVTPRTGIEGVAARTVSVSSVGPANAYGIRIAMPPSYDSRKPSPVAICFHGNGSNETTWATNANGITVANALNAAGYIVLSAANTANVSTWGAQAGLDAYYYAYQALRDAGYPLGPVVLYANSMGGIESLLTLAARRIPGIVAWCGTSPTTNLADNYTGSGGVFTATINTAYGITGNAPNTYALLTAGHDPMLMSGSAFRGVPMLFLAATDDTTVLKTNNTDPMAALCAPYASSVTVVPTTGGHSFNFAPYTGQIVSFFNQWSKG